MAHGLATAAARGLGYNEKSLLHTHMKGLQDRYLKQNPQSAQAWLDNYKTSSQKLMRGHISREPLGVQHAIHNHILHTVLGGKTDNLKMSDAEMRKFMKNLHKAHGHLATHYGVDHDLGHPPFDHRAALAKGALPPTMPGQVPQGGAPQGGVPSGQQHADTRAALGMNPMPPSQRHPLPMSLAPGAGVPVAQKALTPPPAALPH